jgi:hypothetical protein
MADVDAFLASLNNIPGIGANAPPPKADPAELAEAATATWGSFPSSEGYAEDVEAGVNLPPLEKAPPPPPPAAVEPVPTATIYELQASSTVAAATSESEVTAVAARVAWAPGGASSEAAISTAVAVARSDAEAEALLFAEAEAAAELALLEAARSPDAAPEEAGCAIAARQS